MSTSPEVQSNFAEHVTEDEITAEFTTSEIQLNGIADKALVLHVLDEVARRNIEVGGDEAALVPEELVEEYEELRTEWMEDPYKPVVLTGETAEHIYNVFKVVAETDELDRDTRNRARHKLGEPLIPEDENWVQAEKERIQERHRGETAEEVGQSRKAGTLSSLNLSQEQASGKERIAISTTGELIAIHNAIEALIQSRGDNMNTTGDVDAVVLDRDQILEGRKLAFNGAEAHLVRTALQGVADGTIKNPMKDPINAEYEQQNAQYILKAWDGEPHEAVSNSQEASLKSNPALAVARTLQREHEKEAVKDEKARAKARAAAAKAAVAAVKREASEEAGPDSHASVIILGDQQDQKIAA